MKTYTEKEKYDLAAKLDAVKSALLAVTAEADMDCDEDWLDAMDDAMELISPQYMKGQDAARDAAIW